MEASGVGPGPEPFLRAEVVHASERTRITRLFLPGRTVIRKEPLGPDAERRVRHEAAMLERLLGVAGVAQLAEAQRSPGPVVLEDAGGGGPGRWRGCTDEGWSTGTSRRRTPWLPMTVLRAWWTSLWLRRSPRSG